MPYDDDNEAYLDESEEIDDSDLDDGDDGDDDESETLPCPECGKPVYGQAERCPHCGSYITPADDPARGKSWWFLIAAILCLVVVVVIWVLLGSLG